jgi:hypothetical protein
MVLASWLVIRVNDGLYKHLTILGKQDFPGVDGDEAGLGQGDKLFPATGCRERRLNRRSQVRRPPPGAGGRRMRPYQPALPVPRCTV